MTYLDLINAVLVRLREERVTASTYDLNPYSRVIAACVNDAKRQVENAWNWSANRHVSTITVASGNNVIQLTDSVDTAYVPLRVLNADTNQWLTQTSEEAMNTLYGSGTANTGAPTQWASYVNYWDDGNDADPLNGLMQLRLNTTPTVNTDFDVYHTRQQGDLTLASNVLKIPSLPVFALATALASRERGEIGNTPSSELFGIAGQYLSDAIANDSARFPEDLIWYVAGSNDAQTNVRNY